MVEGAIMSTICGHRSFVLRHVPMKLKDASYFRSAAISKACGNDLSMIKDLVLTT